MPPKIIPDHPVTAHYLPFAALVSVISGVIWLTVLITDLRNDIKTLRAEIRWELGMQNDRVARLESTCWTKQDHQIWAARVGIKETP